MEWIERPKLRPLSSRQVEHRGESFVALDDSLGLLTGSFLIPMETFRHVVRHFDGGTTLEQIRERVQQESGQFVSIEDLQKLVGQLDQAMVLEGPTFATFRDSHARVEVRPPALAGRSYPASMSTLKADLDRHFVHPDGSGMPRSQTLNGSNRLRAILSPHIDFGRGGPTYTWAYRELVERSDAEVFVILGVAHQYCRNRFALTRKDFQTPLGTARTDRAFVDRVAELAGPHVFEDELAHRTEHSIEFQVVFLQHVLADREGFTIVPILVGSFHDLMARGVAPIDDPEVGRMVEALRQAEVESGKRVVYIGGIDLCHVGPEFGDPGPVDDGTLSQVRAFDESILQRAAQRDPAGWFEVAAEVGNRWRVCGLAATYTLLQTIGPASGKLLHYKQAVNETRTCCVTFASVAFERPIPTDSSTHD